MRFGLLSPEEAVGAILAHRIAVKGRVLKKGQRLSAADVALLSEAGWREVPAARLDPGDVGEDEAAARIARALQVSGLSAGQAFTGRCNLHAERAGLVLIDEPKVHALNALHEGITLATLPPYAPVSAGELVATVKIIPFALPDPLVRRAEELAARSGALELRPFRRMEARLIQTLLPATPPKVLDKTVSVLQERMARLGGALLSDNRCPHEVGALAAAMAEARRQGFDLLLVIGASATTDRRDVIPMALEAAGGRVLRFGMPVDPGNLLVLAELDGRPVLALPGSARSPKRSGVDWVMERIAAGVPVDSSSIAQMGVGGLLSEIPSRPRPRELPPAERELLRVGAVVLAAGRGRRMGPDNKLLLPFGGKPMIRHVVEAVLASRARPVVVVVGHESERVVQALAHLGVQVAVNPDFDAGLARSLQVGVAALPAEVDGVVVVLGDMPRITAPLLDRLIDAFRPEEGAGIVVPVRGGVRGHPVLFGRAFFDAIRALQGDVGARSLLAAFPEAVREVEVEDAAIHLDVDTPEQFSALLERAR